MAQLPPYTTAYKRSDGVVVYRFNPPQHLVDNKIVPRVNLGCDKKVALAKAKAYNEKIKQYREGAIAGALPSPRTKIVQLIQSYYDSKKYKALSHRSQKAYEYALSDFANFTIEGRKVGDIAVEDVTVRMCNMIYQTWAENAVTSANKKRSIVSVLFNYAMKWEAVTRNPMAYVDAISSKPRKVKWTKNHIKTFLRTGYSDYRYRNITLIVHMAYEWCQRIGDIRLLKWSDIDFDAKTVTITQSKRGATVYLPITDGLFRMLEQQKEDFGFQDYVVPVHRKTDNAWRPYDERSIGILVNEVKTLAGLPEEIKAWDLRRTGITELVEAGVDTVSILQVSGHANVKSVQPYLVNTLEGASNALSQRFKKENTNG